jgi:hypothetical protein
VPSQLSRTALLHYWGCGNSSGLQFQGRLHHPDSNNCFGTGRRPAPQLGKQRLGVANWTEGPRETTGDAAQQLCWLRLRGKQTNDVGMERNERRNVIHPLPAPALFPPNQQPRDAASKQPKKPKKGTEAQIRAKISRHWKAKLVTYRGNGGRPEGDGYEGGQWRSPGRDDAAAGEQAGLGREGIRGGRSIPGAGGGAVGWWWWWSSAGWLGSALVMAGERHRGTGPVGARAYL